MGWGWGWQLVHIIVLYYNYVDHVALKTNKKRLGGV